MPQINLLSPGSQAMKEPKILAGQELRMGSMPGFKSGAVPNTQALIFRSSICASVVILVWIILFVNVSGKEKVLRGLEAKIAERLAYFRELDKKK